jgi:hypothetical protein
MMLVICTSTECKTVTRLLSREVRELISLVGSESEWWPNKYRCPRCEGQATGTYEAEIDLASLRGFSMLELEAPEFFRFMMGVGLPEEQNCRIEVLQKIFREGKVKNLAGHPIPGTTRFCLEWLEMEDGTHLYFGSSTHGATIYRIANRPDYTKKALENGS